MNNIKIYFLTLFILLVLFTLVLLGVFVDAIMSVVRGSGYEDLVVGGVAIILFTMLCLVIAFVICLEIEELSIRIQTEVTRNIVI